MCLAPVGEARAKPREDVAFWKVSKRHLLLINWWLSGSPGAILRPPKWRDLSRVSLCLCSQIKQSINQSYRFVIANTAGAIQGLQMHALLFSVALKPVLPIFTVLLPKLAGICLKKTVLGPARSNLAIFYPRRIIVSYLSSLCQQNKTDDTRMFRLSWEVVYVVIAVQEPVLFSSRGLSPRQHIGVGEAGLFSCSALEICFGSLFSFHGMSFLEIPQTDKYHKRWGGPDTWCAGTAMLLGKRKRI